MLKPNSVTETHAATLMAGAQGCCGKGPIKSISICTVCHAYFTPYMQDLGGALLMSFQIFYAHVHMHRTCLLFGTCHAHVCRILSRHLPLHANKLLRYFGQRLILSKVTTIKFRAMISFKNVYLAQDVPKYE